MSYRDKDVLEKLYVHERLPYAEIGEKFDVHQSTIGTWVNKFDLKRPYEDPEILKDLYWNKGLSTRQIADRLDCGERTIGRQLNNNNIKVRKPSHERPAYFGTDNNGYEIWRTEVDGKLLAFSVHRLLAIAEFGPESVKGKSVHHKSGVPWDNRPNNLEIMEQGEHVNKEHKDDTGRFIPVSDVE